MLVLITILIALYAIFWTANNWRRVWHRFALGVPLVFALGVVQGHAQAGCTVTVDPDRASLVAAISAASSGHVICLNPGSVTYDAQVDPTELGTKALEIRGAGSFVSPWGSAGQTIITVRGTGAVFGGYEVTMSEAHPTISNIRFIYDGSSPILTRAVSVSVGAGIGEHWIVHHNDFFFTDYCNTVVLDFGGSGHGLAYRNKFTAIATAACGYGFTNLQILKVTKGPLDPVAEWETPSTMGSDDTDGDNAVYFETNYVSGFLISDVSTSGRFVARFNEIHNASYTTHGFDSAPTAPRHIEHYNDTFHCDDSGNGHSVALSGWDSLRGGTGMVFNNTYPAFDSDYCGYMASGVTPFTLTYYKASQCGAANAETAGWPGSYMATYPPTHLPGWGWINGSTIAGASTAQNQPGTTNPGYDGFEQDLEPMYFFNNTNNTGSSLINIPTNFNGQCRAMAYSNSGKGGGAAMTLTASAYINAGQDAFVAFVDLVGGTTPAASSNINNSWTALEPGTNDGMRLSAWKMNADTTGVMTVTITFDSSTAARAGALIVMRGLAASPMDSNPAVVTDDTSPYDAAPKGGALAQTNEIVLGYFGLKGPGPLNSGAYHVTGAVTDGGTGYSGNDCNTPATTTGGSGTGFFVAVNQTAGVITSVTTCAAGSGYLSGETVTVDGGNDDSTITLTTYDAVAAASPDLRSVSSGAEGIARTGYNGTQGGAADTNVTIGVTYRIVTDGSDAQPRFTNATENRKGLAGQVSFKVSGNDVNNLDLQMTDLMERGREYHDDQGGGTVTSGLRADRPAATPNGRGYWATDQGGNWDTLHGGANDGCLDIVVAGAWEDCKYVPGLYPHLRADVTGENPEEDQTPGVTSPADLGRLSASTNISLSLAVDDSVIALVTGSVTLTGTAVDIDMDALTYSWRQVAGPHTAVIADPDMDETVVTFSEVGYYAFELTVTDTEFYTTKSIAVTVEP